MAKKKDKDKSLTNQYIRAIENPDSVGFRNGRWYQSSNNAEGEELERPKHWNELSMLDKSDVMAAAVKNGVTTLEDIRKAWDDYADSYKEGSEDSGYRDYSDDSNDRDDSDYSDDSSYKEHQYASGGYKPSASIKSRIANWEGSSMKTNRSFETEAADFNRVIPASIRAKLNQQQLDALYSYGYNVGMGNLKVRVLPMLEQYAQGRAGAKDVANSMWASLDYNPKYRGLRNRRNIERGMFMGYAPSDMQGTMVDKAISMNLSHLPIMYFNGEVSNPLIEHPYYTAPKIELPQEEEKPKALEGIDKSLDEDTGLTNFLKLQQMMGAVGMNSNSTNNSFLGAWNSFLNGNIFADGGEKGVISSNGSYHVNPADYWAVLGNVENGKPVEVTTPEVTVTATDPKKYRSEFHSEDIFPFMNIATAGLLNRGSITQDTRLLSDAYQAIKEEKPWYDVAKSAIFGNEGIFESPWANIAFDVAVPTGIVGASKLASLKNTAIDAAKEIAEGVNLRKAVNNRVSTISDNKNVTNNILKWLGKPENYKPETPLSSIFENKYADAKDLKLAELWRDNGVDLSRIDINDIPKIYEQRINELMSSHPDRYTIAYPSHAPKAYTLIDYLKDKQVGETLIGLDENSNATIDDIHNLTESIRNGIPASVHGVQERGLNAAINVTKSEGGEGVITGRDYQSAPKQYGVVQKYHDRQKVSDDGIHSNTNMVTEYNNAHGIVNDDEELATSMLDLKRAGNKIRKYLYNAPVYLLKTPTSYVPTKASIFNPSIIDKFGKMHIDWTNPDIFKSILYPTLFGTGYSLLNQESHE